MDRVGMYFASLQARYPRNQFADSQFIIGRAIVEMQTCTWDDAELYLAFIKSMEQGQGHATAALKVLTDLADTYKLSIAALVHPLPSCAQDKKRALRKQQLFKWYTRHGFVTVAGDKIVRQPRDV